MSATKRSNDGSALVLAVIFVLVVGLIGGAIASFASSSLAQTSSLGGGRSQASAAEGALQVAIQRVRDLNTAATAPGYGVSSCPSTTVPMPESSTTVSISVVCVVGQALRPFQRKIVFAACPAGTADSDCLTGQSTFKPQRGADALIVATATFYDLPDGCSTVGDGCALAPGTSVDLDQWDASQTTG